MQKYRFELVFIFLLLELAQQFLFSGQTNQLLQLIDMSNEHLITDVVIKLNLDVILKSFFLNILQLKTFFYSIVFQRLTFLEISQIPYHITIPYFSGPILSLEGGITKSFMSSSMQRKPPELRLCLKKLSELWRTMMAEECAASWLHYTHIQFHLIGMPAMRPSKTKGESIHRVTNS